jgi:hypothetical protein
MGEGFSEYGGGPAACVDEEGMRGFDDVGIAGEGEPYEGIECDCMLYEGV